MEDCVQTLEKIKSLDNLNDLNIETNPKDDFLYFNESLKSLKERGFKRHLLPQEFISLIIGYENGNLPRRLKGILEDRYCMSEQWSDMALLREGNTLFCYAHPRTLVWTPKSYDVMGFKSDRYVAHSGTIGKECPYGCIRGELKYDKKLSTSFKINVDKVAKDMEEWDVRGTHDRSDVHNSTEINLKEIGKEFIDYFFGMPFEKLPDFIKEEGFVDIPLEGIITPIGVCRRRAGRFCIGDGGYQGSRMISRGAS